MLGKNCGRLRTPRVLSYLKGTQILPSFRILVESSTFLLDHVFHRYKDAGEALRRKQEKEREAAGLPPLQRLGARAAAPQRGARGSPTGRGGSSQTRGRGQATRGAAPSRGGSPGRFNHDKTLYVHLMGNLKKKSLLPVVVFTLSKKRCEENASTLTNLDLCTSTEKSEVHVAIEKALGRLKGVFFKASYVCFGARWDWLGPRPVNRPIHAIHATGSRA
jgi:hypothetical protein